MVRIELEEGSDCVERRDCWQALPDSICAGTPAKAANGIGERPCDEMAENTEKIETW
jgi:hypothetical protein